MSSRNAKAPSALTAKIEVWIAGVLMLIAFAVGFAISQVTTASQPSPATVQQQQLQGSVPQGVIPAPPLSDQQLQAGLPAGHPGVGSGSSGGSGATPSPKKPDKSPNATP